ncbi:MAG: polysaccharide deacetylase family protein [Acidobacteria bacterium]|nr:polysaccharide deacetylase family protein [Acidobacteriota bacterium]
MNRRPLLRISLGALCLLGFAALPQPVATGRRMAITFDDLPVAGASACDGEMRVAVLNGLLGTMRKRKIRAAGFVNEGLGCGALHVSNSINSWLNEGHIIGNHSFSHRDINSIPLSEYTADVLKGEVITRAMLEQRGLRLRYYRHPFLHAGATPEVKKGLAEFLAANKYEVAAVTFDNQEWVFARAYQRAYVSRNNSQKKRIAQAYLAHMEEVTAFFEKRSQEVLGREPAQILLLHANLLNADHLDPLLAMYRRRGYDFVTLTEALRDPAYEIADGYTGPKGLSWIHRWGLTKGIAVVEEPREPEWVAKAAAGGE